MKWILNYLLVFAYMVIQTFNVVFSTVTTPLIEGDGHVVLVGFHTIEVAGINPGRPIPKLLSPVIVTVKVKEPVLVLPVSLLSGIASKPHKSTSGKTVTNVVLLLMIVVDGVLQVLLVLLYHLFLFLYRFLLLKLLGRGYRFGR